MEIVHLDKYNETHTEITEPYNVAVLTSLTVAVHTGEGRG